MVKISILCGTALIALLGPLTAWSQEAPPPQDTPSTNTAAPASKPSKKKYSHANDFLIRGTVFTEQALAFPGVPVRFRRAGEKKFRWETSTDSRGEFAVRVPQGSNYEVVIHLKGFTEQTRAIDATTGDYLGNLVFRMMPEGESKK
jgi:hypothetical protein